jgi:hypothetical protein
VLSLVKRIKYFFLADFLEFADIIGIIAHKHSKLSHRCQQLHKKPVIVAHRYFYVLCFCQLWQVILALLYINNFTSHFFLSCHIDTWRRHVYLHVSHLCELSRRKLVFISRNSLQVSQYSWQILHAFLSWGLNELLLKLDIPLCCHTLIM